jgi:hypothetical protein
MLIDPKGYVLRECAMQLYNQLCRKALVEQLTQSDLDLLEHLMKTLA